MICTFYVMKDQKVYHSIGFSDIGKPTSDIVAHIQTDDCDYGEHDPNSVCDPSVGVAIQLEYYLKKGKDLTQLKYFRTLIVKNASVPMYVVLACKGEQIMYVDSVWDNSRDAEMYRHRLNINPNHEYKFEIQQFNTNEDLPF